MQTRSRLVALCLLSVPLLTACGGEAAPAPKPPASTSAGPTKEELKVSICTTTDQAGRRAVEISNRTGTADDATKVKTLSAKGLALVESLETLYPGDPDTDILKTWLVAVRDVVPKPDTPEDEFRALEATSKAWATICRSRL
ncbi:hypothetical protein GEV29_10845 [Aeromicrobium sp. SMF47]|uniref:hypothetical protein n=1 Tax=Aeromicrobium TaxID=2040 RepID=UPI00129E5885|nr:MULTISPECIES: hypothetical protein [Aeromicrobium]MRJ77038.1 hypothetical protein [Aeromicrobium yanjiei]MRK01402.1 hypothetical protein [Aeromicrobium sp. S22]